MEEVNAEKSGVSTNRCYQKEPYQAAQKVKAADARAVGVRNPLPNQRAEMKKEQKQRMPKPGVKAGHAEHREKKATSRKGRDRIS